jgi:hypothetical protein
MAINVLDSNWSTASSNAETQLLSWLNTSLFYAFFNNLKSIGFNVTVADVNNIDVINTNIKLVNTYLEDIVNISTEVSNLNIPSLNETSANAIIDSLNDLVKDPDGEGVNPPLVGEFNNNINTAISDITTGITAQGFAALTKSFDQWIQLSNNSASIATLKKINPSDPTLLKVKNTIEFNNPNATLIELFETDVQSKVLTTRTLFTTPLQTLKVTHDLLASLKELE